MFTIELHPQIANCETYYRFADRLSLKDIVITFNYDILLERALEHVGKPYRLFPWRYKKIGDSFHETDSDVEEVTLLKLHGSVDWFDDRDFLDRREHFRAFNLPNKPNHSVFSDNHYSAEPLVQGPRPANDPLLHIHRIRDVDYYYRGDSCLDAPFILAPSNVKFVYAQPLLDLWSGWGRAGAYNLGISVIGFSLPKHDDYVRIMLYQMINNYQQCLWGEKMLGVLKDNVKLVDYRRSDKDIAAYKERYSFVDSARARYMFGGLNHKAIQFIFDQTRY